MIELLVGAGIFGAGQLCGRFLRRRARPKPPKPIQPICGCDHHYALHDEKTGECHAQVKFKVSEGKPILDRYKEYVVAREGATYEVRQCGCRRYTGPEPLPSYYAPELAS